MGDSTLLSSRVREGARGEDEALARAGDDSDKFRVTRPP